MSPRASFSRARRPSDVMLTLGLNYQPQAEENDHVAIETRGQLGERGDLLLRLDDGHHAPLNLRLR
jgi:hypothetical protein